MKDSSFICGDTVSLLEKVDIRLNNPEKWLTIKVNRRTGYGYSLPIHCSFDSNRNKHD